MYADFFLLFFLLGFFFLISKIKTKKEATPPKIHRHGHRCYIEDLSFEERQIVNLLAVNLNHGDYFLFNNIILPSSKTTTTQIDHIVVSKYGIFVIESKNYNHWIFANKHRREWTQTTRSGGKYHFHNPLLQNFAHISALKEQLPFLKEVFFDLIVFSGDCVFKTPRIVNVLYEHELVEFIKSKQEAKLKEVELLLVIGKLSMLCQTTTTTNEEHIKNIKEALLPPIPVTSGLPKE
jgi:hypothetical protein